MTENKSPRFFYGYVVALAAFWIQMIGWGAYCAYGVFFNPLLIEFGWTRATISGAASLSFLIMGFFAITAGKLGDRFGPRIVITGCSAFLGLGYLLMHQVNTIWQLYLFYGVIVAIGQSSLDVLPLSMIARWFVRRRGVMSGIVKVGTGVGIMIMPPIANWLISSYGWRTSYLIIGSATFAFIVLAAQFLRRDPAQKGLLPYGLEEANADHLNAAYGGFSLQEAIHAKQLWMLCAIYLLIVSCTQTILVHIVPHGIELGISAASAASVLAAIGGISIIGRLVVGNASDRIGNKLAMIVCFLMLAVALFWLQLAKELWMLYLFAVIYGVAHGGFFALISPVVAELFGLGSHGVIFGIVIFGSAIGGAIGPVLAGHMFDITGSYYQAFLICAAVAVIGFILTLLLRPPSRKL